MFFTWFFKRFSLNFFVCHDMNIFDFSLVFVCITCGLLFFFFFQYTRNDICIYFNCIACPTFCPVFFFLFLAKKNTHALRTFPLEKSQISTSASYFLKWFTFFFDLIKVFENCFQLFNSFAPRLFQNISLKLFSSCFLLLLLSTAFLNIERT